MAIKRELVATTSTAGWRYIQQIANNVITAAERAAIDEDDEAKGALLRRKAQAMRKGFTDLWTTIEATKQIGIEPTEPDWFADLDAGWNQEIPN